MTSTEPALSASDSDRVEIADVLDAWDALSFDEKLEAFHILPRGEAEDLFCGLSAEDQVELLFALPSEMRRSWLRLLPPDDAADLIQASPHEHRDALLKLLDPKTHTEVMGLLAYAEDAAGGLMSPRYARLRPDMRVDEALAYLHKLAREHVETLYYVYVLDDQHKLVGVASLRELFVARAEQKVRDVVHTDIVSVPETADQEEVQRTFRQHSLVAVPVVDAQGRMKGIVTVDDIVDVAEEEATEDMQKLGGVQALDAPYLAISFMHMIKKRGGWLSVLFLGELLTATAMGFFADKIARAVLLAMFVPLIISSGGNSGSQAATLVIRAMALGEVRLQEWWRVIQREIAAGFVLGSMLGAIGVVRILVWQAVAGVYGEHYLLVALTVGLSLVGVVMFGTICGSMLPFLLRRLGLDPASASAPFVATLVDVTGLLIYFSMASLLLAGTIL